MCELYVNYISTKLLKNEKAVFEGIVTEKFPEMIKDTNAQSEKVIFPKMRKWPNKHMKRCSRSLVTKKVHIKATIIYHFTVT